MGIGLVVGNNRHIFLCDWRGEHMKKNNERIQDTNDVNAEFFLLCLITIIIRVLSIDIFARSERNFTKRDKFGQFWGLFWSKRG